MAKKRIKRALSKFMGPRYTRLKKPGTAPGTVQHIGEKRVEEVQLTVHDYDESHMDEFPIKNVEEIQPYLEDASKTWLKVYGLHDVEKLKSVWAYFDLHPLVQEDIVNTSQRPKAEEYENNLFVVLRMINYVEKVQHLDSEQICIIIGENYVLSFQETDISYFDPVLDRLKTGNIRIRQRGVDYLGYALVDAIVDHYFQVLEYFGERIETIEDELMEDPEQETFRKIHNLRRDLIFFRKAVWPLRDTINSTIRDESRFIQDSTKIYLRDVYDHIIQIVDSIENYRDMIMGMHDMYMNHVSNRMNEVMKVLTIIATIFIPLTFIAGIYGMNFDTGASPYNLPELQWYWGYPAVLLVMAVVATGMIIFFKRKDWL